MTNGKTTTQNGKYSLPSTKSHEQSETGVSGSLVNGKPMNGKHSLSTTTTKNHQTEERGIRNGLQIKSTQFNTNTKPTTTTTTKPTELVLKSSYFQTPSKYLQKKDPMPLKNNNIQHNNVKSKSTKTNTKGKNKTVDEDSYTNDELLAMMSLFDDEPPAPTSKTTNKTNNKTNDTKNNLPKTNSITNNATNELELEDEIFITSLFDDEPNPSVTQKQKQQAPPVLEEEEQEEDDFSLLFGDWEQETTLPSSFHHETNSPYPFFRQLNEEDEARDEAVVGEETNVKPEETTEAKESDKGEKDGEKEADQAPPARKKPRANRRDLFLCKTQEYTKYAPTVVSNSKSSVYE
jgi:hypothetical protein